MATIRMKVHKKTSTYYVYTIYFFDLEEFVRQFC